MIIVKNICYIAVRKKVNAKFLSVSLILVGFPSAAIS